MTAVPITFILPDLGGGGAQKVMLAIAGGLDRARFAPSLLVAGGSQAFAGHVPPDVRIENGGAGRLREGLPWLVRRIRETKPEVCVSVMGYLNLMLLGARRFLPRETKLVIREANTLESTAQALPRWVPGRALYRSLYPLADAIVSPTRDIADAILQVAPRTRDRLQVIANPVDTAVLRSRAEPAKRELGPGLRLVSAGRLTRQKGYDRLLDLMPQLPPDTRLTIFGEGEDRAALEAQASALGLRDRVRLPGFLHESAAWIAGADLFVLPSRWEGLPNVVLEALALGTPAIVSRDAAAEGLAAQAVAGAVKIRPVGDEFLAAILDNRPQASPVGARPSLLPPGYEIEAAVASWSDLVDRVRGKHKARHV